MREIKFRAWGVGGVEEKATTKMRYSERFGDLQAFFCLCYGQVTQPVKGILMQYTGLKDKNGKEIYEGDVVMIEDYYHDYQDGIAISSIPDNRIEAVEWEQRHGMWTVETDALYEVATECEVIGNVWENPELLK